MRACVCVLYSPWSYPAGSRAIVREDAVGARLEVAVATNLERVPFTVLIYIGMFARRGGGGGYFG